MSELSILLAIFTILLTLFVVLLERKFLAYAQRRMGPAVMGRNGVFQIILDLVKLLTKEVYILPRASSALAPVFLALLYATQLAFSQNFIWSNGVFLFENVDSLILFHLILILFANIFFVLVGFLSQSRYAIIGTVRSLIHIMSLDIFVTIVYSTLVLSAQSAHFHDFVLIQNQIWTCFLFSPLLFIFIVILILESKRAPFDHAETESEVVAGYAVEYSGPMLLIFYLAEYLHLVIAAIHCSLFFLGGWYIFSPLIALPPFFLTPYDHSLWLSFFDLFLWA